MLKTYLLISGFMLSVAMGINAEAKVYKWVDDQGITHYGEVIPAEYANKERDSLNKSGLIAKRPERTDPNAKQAKEEADKLKKVENQAAEEQKRRDSAMLNTYSNESEIDQARERSMVLISARIESNRMLLKSSQGTLEGLKNEAETRTKEGKKIPQSLTNDIVQTEARLARYATELGKSEDELTIVKARFEKEKELYRKLKSGTQNH